MSLTVNDILSSSGKYPERAKSPELTIELKANAENLCKRVNNLLNSIWRAKVSVSSGFRPAAVNASLPNAAKKSLHMQCKAVDISDPKGELKKAILEKPSVLEDYGLWMEDKDATPGWCHLDCGIRSPRSPRVFKP